MLGGGYGEEKRTHLAVPFPVTSDQQILTYCQGLMGVLLPTPCGAPSAAQDA
jgi:hypothetical protein